MQRRFNVTEYGRGAYAVTDGETGNKCHPGVFLRRRAARMLAEALNNSATTCATCGRLAYRRQSGYLIHMTDRAGELIHHRAIAA